MITKEDMKVAQRKMLDFVTKHEGESVLFRTLPEEEKEAYVMTRTFIYFDFLPLAERYRRVIGNTEAHKAKDYEVYMENINEHFVIPKREVC